MLDLNIILGYQNVIFMLVVIAIISAIKKTTKVYKIDKKKFVLAIVPWLPILLGLGLSFVPGAIEGASTQGKIITGIALGGISGQIWKIVRTKLELFGKKQ